MILNIQIAYVLYIYIYIYRVLQTLTSVGYGDMKVTGTTERLFTVLLMIIGVGFYSYTIGNLSSIFAIIDSRRGKLNVHYTLLYFHRDHL